MKNLPPPPPHMENCKFIYSIVFGFILGLQYINDARAEVDAHLNWYLHANDTTSTVLSSFAIGKGFFQPPFLDGTYESRLIQHAFNTVKNRFVSGLAVTPNQTVSLDVEFYIEMLSEKVGEVNFNGITYGVYKIPGSTNFGFIADIGIDDLNTYVSADAGVRISLNNEGVSLAPDFSVTITSESFASDYYNPIFYFKSNIYLVWLGPIPITSNFDLRHETNGKLLFRMRVRPQKIIADNVVWETQRVGGWSSFFSYSYFNIKKNATCATPPADQLVKLPMVWANEFTGEGTTRGDTYFNLTFSGCDQYMHAIRYKIYSTPANAIDNTNPANAALGLVSLNNQPGSASGIKVQILDRDTNTPITLDQFRIAPQYTGTQTGFTIPLKARYYQTAPQVSGGKVNATVLFQIIYQ